MHDLCDGIAGSISPKLHCRTGVATLAVDGNTNGRWKNNSVSHTNSESQPWWTGDLGLASNVADIQLWNRTDRCCSSRLANFYVLVSESPFLSETLDTNLNNPSIWSYFHAGTLARNTLSVPVGTVGRYIRIQLEGSNALSLAEVVVNGSPLDTTPENIQPVAGNDSLTTASGVSALIDVLVNDSDSDGDGVLTVSMVSAPANGTAVVQPDGKILYTPTVVLTETIDTFVYAITDNDGGSAEATVTVTIAPANTPPTAENDTATVESGSSVAIDVLANDSDNEGSLTVSLDTAPESGSAVVQSDETILYTSVGGVATETTDTFTYTVTDDEGESSTATVVITITPAIVVEGVIDLVFEDATQSSTTRGAVATRAIDGDTNGNWRNGSVTHTANETQPWWTGDLGDLANIVEIEIYNRTNNCCRARLSNFYVLVSESPFSSGSLDASLNDSSVWSFFHAGTLSGNSLPVPVGVDGRYVRIQLQGTEALSLAEVVVSGIPGVVTPNIAPIANAGADQAVDAGAEITISGVDSYDTDGSITNFLWTENGIEVGTGENITITVSEVGIHTIDLLVTDDEGATGSDSVQITVSQLLNVAPIANAGTDTTVQIGTEVALSGSASSDTDGNIISYDWSVDGTEVDTGENIVLSGLEVGDHTVVLLVTDNDGATDTDSIVITVEEIPNAAPIANAGPDQSATAGIEVTLSASGSSDADGSIVSHLWTDNGTEVGSGEVVTLNDLAAGEHTIDLLVTDDDGATGTDSVTITVTDAPNAAPIADAGSDQSIEAGTQVTLSGSASNDTDGTIASYVWTNNGFEVGASEVIVLDDLTAGVHTIDLLVTDNDGATGTDSITITVTDTPNAAPLAADDSVDQNGDALSVAIDSSLIIDVLSNDTDSDSELNVGSVTSSTPDAVALADGRILYTPAADADTTVPATFTYTVKDDAGAISNPATVTVNVTDEADEVFAANPDTANVATGGSVVIAVLNNDTGDTGAATIETNVSPQATRGWLRIDQEAGTITYTPYSGQSGTDTFGYRLRIVGVGVTEPATVTVTIGTDNPDPEEPEEPEPEVLFSANPDTSSTGEGDTVLIDILANDALENVTVSAINIAVAPVNGTAIVQEATSGGATTAVVLYTPDAETTAGSDSFEYTITNSLGEESNAALVTITLTPPVISNGVLTALHRDGQTFLTWGETAQQDNYHVYRHSAPITASNLSSAQRLTSRWGPLDSDTSVNKYGTVNVPANFVIEDLGAPLTDDTGLFVYTIQSDDSSSGYYAVTTVRDGVESVSALQTLNAPVIESVSQPRDVLTLSVNGGKGRTYTQYMDYSQWNPTLNGYAYNYSVALPASYNPGNSYGLQLQLHAYGEIAKSPAESEYGWQVIQLFPHDPGAKLGTRHTWWYGYSADHNYNSGYGPAAGRIENFTEQRVMRSIEELVLNPDFNIDQQLIHAYGNSMGGSGALSLGMRYGGVFSGIFASQPMTDYANSSRFIGELEQIWGDRSVNLPITNDGPDSQAIQRYNNLGVWEWMNHHDQLVNRRGDTFAYLMTTHGKRDTVIEWDSQGFPIVQAFTDANVGFSAKHEDATHTWVGFNAVVNSLFGLDGASSLRWKYPLDLSYPAIQNASASSNIVPSGPSVDSYNLNIEWATAHTPFDDDIVDTAKRYEITIRSTSVNQTADITPRRTLHFNVETLQSCFWTATDRNTNQQLSAGTVIADLDSLVTVNHFPIVTGTGTRLVIDCNSSTAPNIAPVAADDSVVVGADTTITIPVMSNDSDADGFLENGSVFITTVPENGIAFTNNDGTVTYTPDENTAATNDSFSYTVTDNLGELSNVASVFITIEPPSTCAPAGSKNETVSVLLVGNSLMNEIQPRMEELLTCGGYTPHMATSNPGGYYLSEHDTNTQTTNLIAEGYDLTLLQEQSSSITTHAPPYDTITSLKNKIEAAGGEMGFYQTWGYQNRDPIFTNEILTGYEEVAAYFNAPLIEIGRAWDNFYINYNEFPPFSLYADYAHTTDHGKALVVFVLYAYLTGETPVGLSTLSLSDEDAFILQSHAWDTYQARP